MRVTLDVQTVHLVNTVLVETLAVAHVHLVMTALIHRLHKSVLLEHLVQKDQQHVVTASRDITVLRAPAAAQNVQLEVTVQMPQ